MLARQPRTRLRARDGATAIVRLIVKAAAGNSTTCENLTRVMLRLSGTWAGPGHYNQQMVHQATSPTAIEAARGLFREYEAWLGFDLCFQSFQRELDGLPGDYAPPGGALFLAAPAAGEEPVGCAGIRRLGPETVELKRLFVRPAWHGRGLGKQLLTAAIDEAVALGYQRMWLDTVPQLTTAIDLYRRWGFREIPPYNSSPIPGALYFELSLTGQDAAADTPQG